MAEHGFTPEDRTRFLTATIELFTRQADQFGTPTQDVLRLMVVSRAELTGKPHNLSTLSAELRMPLATTSRWVDRMIQKNILVNEPDRMHSNSAVLTVNPEWWGKQSDSTRQTYERFLNTIANAFPK